VTLTERLLALHDALARRRIPHAFGGAIALAYWIRDPRGTDDIDINVFVTAEDAAKVLAALPDGISQPEGTVEAIGRDGQVRLFWDETPIDLFFQYAPIHEQAADNRQTVTFLGRSIPILGPNELAVFKIMFDRTLDWADIENMLAHGAIDEKAVVEALRPMIPENDHRFQRFEEAGHQPRSDKDTASPGVPAEELRPRRPT
jgi:hypothetical protein